MRLRCIKIIFSSTYRKGVQVSNEDESQLGPGEANIQPRHVLQEPNTLPSCEHKKSGKGGHSLWISTPVLWIRDILVWILRLMDPDPAPDPIPVPTLFFIDFKDAKKIFFFHSFSINLPSGTSSSV